MKILALVLILIISVSTLVAQFASAEIMVAPTRVVLENGERSSELILVNKGSETAAFRIDVENRRMKMDGSLESALEARPQERFAKEFIRFSPRRVILEPGARQTVRISVQTAGLEPGEYRSHLRLRSAPVSAGRTLESISNGGEDGISIQLVAIRSITIPIIARVGKLDASVELDTARLAPSDNIDESLLVLNLNRAGTKSTYGDIEVYTDDQSEPVYIARGIAIYMPNNERDVWLPIPDALKELLRNKNVRIAYVSSDPQNPKTYADIRTVLN